MDSTIAFLDYILSGGMSLPSRTIVNVGMDVRVDHTEIYVDERYAAAEERRQRRAAKKAENIRRSKGGK